MKYFNDDRVHTFSYIELLLKKSIYTIAVYAFFMCLVRFYLFIRNYNTSFSTEEVINAFLLGLRLDLSVLGYVFTPILFYLIFLSFTKSLIFIKVSFSIVKFYLILILIIVSVVLFSDIAFFSYFYEHINIMIFGIINDDTKALIEIAKQNYDVTLISILLVFFFCLLIFIVNKILSFKEINVRKVSFTYKFIFFIGLIMMTFLVIRGSIGTFPLYKYIPDILENKFINSLPQNGIFALKSAIKDYKSSKEGTYNLIKENGYEGKIDQAIELFLNKKNIDRSDLIKNLYKITPKNEIVEKNPPHVVVIMVESFGLPILKYQSIDFNIMGALEKHFSDDLYFKNFISTGNGTISSLEALLLNIPSRPKSTPLSQSKYRYSEFQSAAAKVYQDKGYETSFVYGGNLSWRNVGSFYSYQGFDNIYGQSSISKELNLEGDDVNHEWGIFDEYSYSFVLEKLQDAKKPQFIFLLTTNNHPPFNTPKKYQSKSLKLSKEIKKSFHEGDKILLKRLKDYAYALDQAGEFMNKIKKTDLQEKTIVGITADNNTIEGMMNYDDYYNESKKIPFYLYMPNYLKKEYNDTISGSHKDIFPTIYNISLSEAPYISLGTDLYDSSILHCGFNKAGVIMTKEGGFNLKNVKTLSQKECSEYYKATLSISEYLIKKDIGE